MSARPICINDGGRVLHVEKRLHAGSPDSTGTGNRRRCGAGAVKMASEIRAARAHGRDIGGMPGLRRYHAAHDRAARPIYLGTNMLVGLYTDDGPPARIARNALLHLGNLVHPARRAIMRQLTDNAA